MRKLPPALNKIVLNILRIKPPTFPRISIQILTWIIPILLFIYIGTIIFKPGYIIYIDVTEGLDVDNLYQRYIYTFSNDIGESLAEKARIPLFYTIFAIFKLTTLDDSYYVKIKLMFLLLTTFFTYTVLAIKFLKFIKKDDEASMPVVAGAVFGGLFYIVNYWSANRIMHFLLFFSSVAIPITFYLTYTFLFDSMPKIRRLFWLVVLLSVFTPTPHTVLFEALIITTLYLSFLIVTKHSLKQKMIFTLYLVGFGILYALANTYWIMPYLVSLSKPDAVLTEDIVKGIGKNANLLNSVRLMGYWLIELHQYFYSQSIWLQALQKGISYLPPFLAFATLVHYKRRKDILIPFVLLLVAGIFLATSENIVHTFYFYLMFHSPIKFIGWIFREYDKFGLIIAFCYSMLISILMSKMLSRKEGWEPLALIAFYLLALISHFYFFNKTLVQRYTPQQVPNDFNEVNQILRDDPEDFNVVWYPGTEKPFWANNQESRFVFTNMLSAKPAITNRSEIFNYLNYVFEKENTYSINVGRAMDLIGVKYIIVRRDTNVFDSERLDEALDLQASLEPVKKTQYLSVYRNLEYTGLTKVYQKQLVTNRGLDALKDLDTLKINTSNTLINYTDKPSNISELPTFYDISNENELDTVINEYKDKFIFPARFINKKEDGNPGDWKKASLESINHAETDFFFENLGLNVNQFDYAEGIAIGRDTYKQSAIKLPPVKTFELSFLAHPGVSINDQKLTYTSSEFDFRYYWNIIRSNKFVVQDTKALELNLNSNINTELIPHFKIYFYDDLRNLVKVVFIYPDERNKVRSVIKVPAGATLADFSIWTKSTPDIQYSYSLDNLSISDISNNVKPVDFSFKTSTNCTSTCTAYTRVLKSQIGGTTGIVIGDKEFTVETKLPEVSEHNEKFVWVRLGEVNLNSNENTISLKNLDGFNAINAIVLLTSEEESNLNWKTTEIKTVIASQQIPEENLAPTRGPLTIMKNPVEYKIQNTSNLSGEVLAFAKLFNPNWQITNNEEAKDKIINGYINGWDIKELDPNAALDSEYTIKYKPQKYFNIGAGISGGTLFIVVISYLIYLWIQKLKYDNEHKIHRNRNENSSQS